MRIGMVCSLIFGGCITSAVIAQTPTPSNNSSAPTINVTVDSPGSNPPTSEPQPSDPTASPIHALADNDTPNRVWFNAEYVLWFIRGQSAPPLLQSVPGNTTGSSLSTAQTPTTLFPSDERINYHMFNGLRLQGGFWFSSEPRLGLDASGFFLDQNSNGASFSSPGIGGIGLARPYINAATGLPASFAFARTDPSNPLSGSMSAESTVSSLYGAEMNLRWNGPAIFVDQTDYLFGFRYLNFQEQLDITGHATRADGSQYSVSDHFATTNQFYGEQIGINSHLYGYRGFSLDGAFKFAMGAIEQQADISGNNTTISSTGVVTTQARGLYAQPSNIGSYSRTMFTVLPEINLNVSYHFTQNFSVYLGYNILWLNNVARPGSQINPDISDANLKLAPTPATQLQPQFAFHEDSFWVQGFNVGFRLQY